MKRRFIILLFVLSFVMVGCTNEKLVSDYENEQTTFVNNTKDTTKATDTTKETVKETEETTKKVDAQNMVTKPDNESKALDISQLEGLVDGLLIKSYYENVNPPTNYMTVTVTDFMGIKSKMISYYYEGNLKHITENENSTDIMIYNAAENAQYQYTQGADTGNVIIMGDGEEDFMESDNLLTPDNIDESALANIVDYNGEKAIMITIDYPELQFKSYTWVSIEKGLPLKSETYQNEELVMYNELISFESLKDPDLSIFERPEDVEFMQFDINMDNGAAK